MLTYFDVSRAEDEHAGLVELRVSLQSETDQLVKLKAELSPIAKRLSELIDPDSDIPMHERQEKIHDLKVVEEDLRQQIAALLTPHGGEASLAFKLEETQQREASARERLKCFRAEYETVTRDFAPVEQILAETKKSAAKIDKILKQLAPELEIFFAKHAELRKSARDRGAPLNMGHGVGLERSRIDGILQAMLHQAGLANSLTATKPGPGLIGQTLSASLPDHARQYLGEPVAVKGEAA